MEVVDEIEIKSKRLFLQPDANFHMVFCKASGSYLLKNPKSNKCHPLEVFLIVDHALSGKKIADICKLLKKNPRWILGFKDAYANKSTRYNSADYLEGYATGKNAHTKFN